MTENRQPFFLRLRRCFRSRVVRLGIILGALLFAGLLAVVGYLEKKLSLRSNLIYLEFGNHRSDLMVKDATGRWVGPDSLTPESFTALLDRRVRLAGDGYLWRTMRVRRKPIHWREKLINALCASEIHIIEFDPDRFEFFPWYEMNEAGRFEPQTYRTALGAIQPGDTNCFVINANYYGPDGQPLGWIVKDGQTIRKQWKNWSGFFFVVDGKPRFGPRSSLEAHQGTLQHALQGYPSVMKGGMVWKYVENDGDLFFNGSELNFRSLAGVTKDGKCIFILSGQGGLMTMADVSAFALLAGIRDATLLDGGKALQYGFRGPRGTFGFHSYNNELPKSLFNGRLEPQQPPVFLAVRAKVAQDG